MAPFLRAVAALLLAVPAAAAAAVVRLPPAWRVPPAAAARTVPALAAAPLPPPAALLPAPALGPAPVGAAIPVPDAAGVPAAAADAVPAARTALGLRDDADRLYAALAALHSREKAGEAPESLVDLKRALVADFDGVIARLPAVDLPEGAAPAARVRQLRTERAKAERALARAEGAGRLEASRRLAAVSTELAAAQTLAARALLGSSSPVGPRAFKRNAALWALVGAHNSAAAAAAEASRLEALARAERAFGDGRPYVYAGRWVNLHARLDEAARHARAGRAGRAAEALRETAALLRDAGRDRADAAAAEALLRAAEAPESTAILAAKALIPHPSLKALVPVAYDDMPAALRAHVHALDSNRKDYLETLERETSIRRAAAALAAPRVSVAETAAAYRDLYAAEEWAKRGHVEGKRLALRNLAAARAAEVSGDSELAARHAGWAADALAERRDELERIGLSLKQRLLSKLR